MAKRLWLLFAQIVTALLAILFIVGTFKPHWLDGSGFNPVGGGLLSTVTVKESNIDPSTPNPGSHHEAVKRSMPAVVNVFTSKNIAKEKKRNKSNNQGSNPHQNDPWFNFFFGDQTPNSEDINPSLCSGVIVSSEGLVLTNQHVIEGADQIEVALADGRKTRATLIGSDPDTDLAVLKINVPNLPNPITFGKIESVRVGDVVLAIGNPFGVGQTVTSGIVSALGREQLGINTFENFIQTDAAINPGNSGGALVDTRGHLIGINTAIYSRSGGSMGIGFAIPVSTAKEVMESIVTNGGVIRGWIGVEPQNITTDIAQTLNIKTEGVLINGVLKGGPADKAGIQPGDVLKKINNKNVSNITELLNNISRLAPGSKANASISRKGKDLEVEIQIGKRPKPKSVR
jgi:serine protease DegQ